ncbi:MAG: hypothetical protein CL768_01550 [Chloroflexi bacterium]|nr:hypothetical protein [Chloroflexota bacterium]|tara:strand:+ start:864 stop:1484 length:621 start_codon:yes stop_codon:yes gene_type:complete
MLDTYIYDDLLYDSDWYLAKTKPLSEKLALKSIESIGHLGFLPLVKVINGNHKEKEVCIFPGYIFVKSGNYDDELPDIRSINFLSGWVKFDGKVSSVSNKVISDLMSYSKELNSEGGLWTRFEIDEIVEVFISGFAVKAKILTEPSTPYDDILVLMKFMGRDIKTSVNWKYINTNESNSFKNKLPRRTRGKGRIIKNKNHKFMVKS